MTRLWVALGLAVVALGAAAVTRLVLFPFADDPLPTDAVVVLAGSPADRLPVARELAEAGPGILVVSAPRGQINAPAHEVCEAPGELTVLCFTPSPSDTRGEAQAIGRLAAERGWARITVVTSTYHVTRARLSVTACTDAEVAMVAAEPSMTLRGWLIQIGHEIGGLAATTMNPAC